MKQQTLRKEYSFEGKGLHTGKYVRMTLCPAPENSGIRFLRTDIGPDAFVNVVASNVSRTARSTTISCGKAKVGTVEHLLSALTGLGVDNALVRIDGPEVPILDGSARLYVEAVAPDGVERQEAERVWIEPAEEIVMKGRGGAYVRIIPSDKPEYEVTIDFNSRVLGVQTVRWNESVDYVEEVAPCRTFCFFNEIEKMAFWGLIKGGDVDNAIIVVEKTPSERKVEKMAKIFKQPVLEVTPEGYLSNLVLRFPDECGRHKLLDLIGDLRLCGGFLKARVVAFKPGHKLNTGATKKLLEASIKK